MIKFPAVLRSRVILMIAASLLFAAGAVVYVNANEPDYDGSTQVAPFVAEEPEQKREAPKENPSTREARIVADKYLDAVRVCDRARMDAFRITPINDENFAYCHADDMKGFTVDSGQLLEYESGYDKTSKTKVETASFVPRTTPGNSSFGIDNIVHMIRYPEADNIWKVSN